jgi:hypothetical protein
VQRGDAMLRRNRQSGFMVWQRHPLRRPLTAQSATSFQHAICNDQMAGNWAPHPKRRLLKNPVATQLQAKRP